METRQTVRRVKGYRSIASCTMVTCVTACKETLVVRRLDCTMLFVDRGLSIDIIFDFVSENERQREEENKKEDE